MEVTFLYNLISEMTAYHFFPTLFIAGKPVTPVHTQRQEILQGHEYQEVGFMVGHL